LRNELNIIILRLIRLIQLSKTAHIVFIPPFHKPCSEIQSLPIYIELCLIYQTVNFIFLSSFKLYYQH